jgi:two-component system CheB/CheR fusion protein
VTSSGRRSATIDPAGGSSQPLAATHPAFSPFPVVAIGASAGGLEAFEQFFRAIPADSGMGFELVQHLDPTHTSILSEILQRSTAMPVVEARHQMPIERNHVYVIPPNHDMVIERGALSLSVSSRPRGGGQMAIDRFFRSLAEDQGEFAVGIVLSGTGSDGTLGLRAIHGAGGLCLVQDPASAKYDGMLASAIRAGFANQVLAVEDMLKALDADARLRRLMLQNPNAATADKHLARVLMRLRSATGHPFIRMLHGPDHARHHRCRDLQAGGAVERAAGAGLFDRQL